MPELSKKQSTHLKLLKELQHQLGLKLSIMENRLGSENIDTDLEMAEWTIKTHQMNVKEYKEDLFLSNEESLEALRIFSEKCKGRMQETK